MITQGDYYFAQLIADKQKIKAMPNPYKIADFISRTLQLELYARQYLFVLDRFLERNLFGLAYRHTETDFCR